MTVPTPFTFGATTPTDPIHAAGLMRAAALARILHFENTMHRRFGVARTQRYLRLFNYWSGQNLPPDNVEQPLNINYYRVIADKHTSYLWGQWRRDIMTYRVSRRGAEDSAKDEDATAQVIARYLNNTLDANDRNALLWEASHNGAVYGDSIIRLRWDPVLRKVAMESLLPEWFHCRWDVTNMRKLSEVIVSYPIDRLDAQQKYGTSGNPAINFQLVNPEYVPGFAIFWEHWTPTSYRQWIDDICIAESPNPYMMQDQEGNLYPGIIPFVHVPNLRVAGEFWGYADPEGIIYLQDEINRRMADMGDAVNNFAHPVVTLRKYYGDMENLSIGPDAVWDLGKEGEAELLQWSGSPPSVMEYLQLLKDVMHDTSAMPDIAFGRMVRGGGSGGGGGSSRGAASGIALQIALMPVVERAKMKRINWTLALKELAHMTSFIHAVKDPATLPFDFARYNDYEVIPTYADILPRDRLQQVNENVALTAGGLRSIERALSDMGEEHVAAEFKRIRSDLQFKAKLGMQLPQQPGTPSVKGGKNGAKPQGGSNSLPGGPGASSASSGQAKEA